MSELDVTLRLKADGSGLVGQVRVSQRELDKLAQSTSKAGKSAKGAARDTDKFTSSNQRGAKSAKTLNDRSKNLGRTLIGLVATYVSLRKASEFVADFKKQEQAVAALDASITSMGRTTVGLSQNLQNLAAQIQRQGIIGDEAIIQGQSFLTTYSDIADNVLPRATRVMVDLAAKMGGDVVSAANLVGKASLGMTGELSRVGITLSDEAKRTKDFTLILRDMESQVSGINKALGQTATGGIDQFKNALSDSNEKLGLTISLVESSFLQELGKNLDISTNQAITWSESLFEGAAVVIKGFALISTSVLGVVDAFNILRLADAELELRLVQGASLVSEAYFNLRHPFSELTKQQKEVIAKNKLTVLQFKAEIADIKLELSELGSNLPLDKANALIDASRKKFDELRASANQSAAALNSTAKAQNNGAKAAFKMSDAQKSLLDRLLPVRKAQKDYNQSLKELNALKPHLSAAEYQKALKALNKELKSAIDKSNGLAKAVNPIAQIYKDTATTIRQSFRDTFRQVLDDGVDGFKGLADKVKNIFKDLLADLLTLAASRKIIIPIVTSVGSSLGISQSAIASVTQQLGGGAAGTAGGAPTGIAASLSKVPFIGPAIAKFLPGGAGAASAAGTTGAGFINVPGLGPLSTASLGTAALALGAGFAGNRLGNFASGQLGIRTNDGGTVGSVVLGGVGAFFGGPIGAAIGSFVGDIVGNAIGSALGFGKSKVKVQVGTATDLSTAQAARFNNVRTTPFGVVGLTDRSNNFGGGLGKGITDLLSTIDTTIAKLLTTSQVATVKAGLTKGSIGVGTRIKAHKFDNEIFTVAKERLVTIIDSLANNQVASKLLDGIAAKQGNVKALVNKAGEIVQLINLFRDPGEPINAAQQAINALNSKFDQLAGAAKKLGFSIQEVERKRSEQIAKLGSDFDKSIRDQILAIQDPAKLALENQAKVAQERIDNATALGRKLNEVERLTALERTQIIQEQFGSLNDLITQLTRQSLTPVQQIDALVADFNTALADNNIGSLNATAQNLIAAGRDAFASGPQFQQLTDQLVAALLAVQDRNATNQTSDLPPI